MILRETSPLLKMICTIKIQNKTHEPTKLRLKKNKIKLIYFFPYVSSVYTHSNLAWFVDPKPGYIAKTLSGSWEETGAPNSVFSYFRATSASPKFPLYDHWGLLKDITKNLAVMSCVLCHYMSDSCYRFPDTSIFKVVNLELWLLSVCSGKCPPS